MRPLIYEIVFWGNAWHFVGHEAPSAPYQTQAAAMRAAEGIAREKGADARVRIYQFDGVLQEERIYTRPMAAAPRRQKAG